MQHTCISSHIPYISSVINAQCICMLYYCVIAAYSDTLKFRAKLIPCVAFWIHPELATASFYDVTVIVAATMSD